MTERTLEPGAEGAEAASRRDDVDAAATGTGAGRAAITGRESGDAAITGRESGDAAITGRESGDAATASAGSSAGSQAADGAAIARLTDDLLPALIARLGASGLGEIEVRRAGWKVRLRNPVGERRASGVPGEAPRTQRSLPGHGPRSVVAVHAPLGTGTSRQGGAPAGGSGATASAQPATGAGGADPVAGSGQAASQDVPPSPNHQAPNGTAEATGTVTPARPHHVMATSPAVGYFQPRREQPVGSRVRTGDRVGTVDVLGVRQDVLAPVDGVIGASLVQSGEAVEYGQELLRIELPASPAAGSEAAPHENSEAPERIEPIGSRRAATMDRH